MSPIMSHIFIHCAMCVICEQRNIRAAHPRRRAAQDAPSVSIATKKTWRETRKTKFLGGERESFWVHYWIVEVLDTFFTRPTLTLAPEFSCRWLSESCGGDHDWRALESKDPAGPGMQWCVAMKELKDDKPETHQGAIALCCDGIT